jgi:hypothetical protein
MSEKSAKKPPTKIHKQRRRRTLTFVRMFRYGLNNFSRNIWLTVAATAVMSVTLIIWQNVNFNFFLKRFKMILVSKIEIFSLYESKFKSFFFE